MNTIDWKKIKLIARPDSWYDEGTEAFFDNECYPFHNYTSSYFIGKVDGYDDGELCSIFEFDWIDENGNCINSNIPYIGAIIQHDNYIIEDYETGEKYNWLENRKL